MSIFAALWHGSFNPKESLPLPPSEEKEVEPDADVSLKALSTLEGRELIPQAVDFTG